MILILRFFVGWAPEQQNMRYEPFQRGDPLVERIKNL